VSIAGGNPLVDELLSMKQRMDTLYAQSFRESAVPADPATGEETWMPAVDCWEVEGSWMILVDLPGVLEKDLEVSLDQGRLAIRGERRAAPGVQGGRQTRAERPQGVFALSIALPQAVASDDIRAELRQGVLTLEISRKPANARAVRVEAR
jgi:HSP20 family protein